MDPQTLAFYASNAATMAQRYEAASSPMERYFAAAFMPGARVLDIGCGSGRDAARLMAHGYDAYGIEPVAAFREAAVTAHPELAGRIEDGALPQTGPAFGGGFDGVMCTAVLMHLQDTDLLDAALAIRRLLKPRGRLLLSIPASRSDVRDDHRDEGGRLFSPYTADEISLLFERLGFAPIGRWDTEDVLKRSGTSWRSPGNEQRRIRQEDSHRRQIGAAYGTVQERDQSGGKEGACKESRRQEGPTFQQHRESGVVVTYIAEKEAGYTPEVGCDLGPNRAEVQGNETFTGGRSASNLRQGLRACGQVAHESQEQADPRGPSEGSGQVADRWRQSR